MGSGLSRRRGGCAGVGAVRPDGSVEQVGCRALIIATCGFGANAEMLAEFIPEITEARYYGHEGSDGAGIQLGRLLGANVEYMSAINHLGHWRCLIIWLSLMSF